MQPSGLPKYLGLTSVTQPLDCCLGDFSSRCITALPTDGSSKDFCDSRHMYNNFHKYKTCLEFLRNKTHNYLSKHSLATKLLLGRERREREPRVLTLHSLAPPVGLQILQIG